MDLSEAGRLARGLMNEHGLTNWMFQFDRAKKRFGRCSYTNKTISLSEHLTRLNRVEVVTDTILHEISHAIAGHDAGHGHRWQQTARSLGCSATRCYDTTDVVAPPSNYIGTCPNCNVTTERMRLTDKAQRLACGVCCKRFNGGRYSATYKFVWKRNYKRW